MLLDEPFAGIDPIAVGDIQDLVQHLKGRGIGVLITDHNVRETLGLIDRAYIIHSGHVLTEGRPDAIVAQSRRAALLSRRRFPDVTARDASRPELETRCCQRRLSTLTDAVVVRLRDCAFFRGRRCREIVYARNRPLSNAGARPLSGVASEEWRYPPKCCFGRASPWS